jgi:hypothetical protein
VDIIDGTVARQRLTLSPAVSILIDAVAFWYSYGGRRTQLRAWRDTPQQIGRENASSTQRFLECVLRIYPALIDDPEGVSDHAVCRPVATKTGHIRSRPDRSALVSRDAGRPITDVVSLSRSL